MTKQSATFGLFFQFFCVCVFPFVFEFLDRFGREIWSFTQVTLVYLSLLQIVVTFCSGAPISAEYQRQQIRVGPLAGDAGSLKATDVTGANQYFGLFLLRATSCKDVFGSPEGSRSSTIQELKR